MPSTQFRNQNKINFYVFITCDNSLASAQLTGWKPAAATRCHSASIGLHLLGARSGPGLQHWESQDRRSQVLEEENRGNGNVCTYLCVYILIPAI